MKLFMMLLSYTVVTYIDTGGLKKLNEKGLLPLYLTLMALSCAIGTVGGYAASMPSPMDPIKRLVMSIFYN
jgi:hypothetical protein